MTEREMVVAHLTERMIAEFAHGNFVDAQNINTYLSLLDAEVEGPSDSFEQNAAAA